jgi:hypothetical protein
MLFRVSIAYGQISTKYTYLMLDNVLVEEGQNFRIYLAWKGREHVKTQFGLWSTKDS